MTLVLKLEIELGNDAMQTAVEAKNAIESALINGTASMLDPMVVGDAAPIRDANGNTVGRFFVDDKGRI